MNTLVYWGNSFSTLIHHNVRKTLDLIWGIWGFYRLKGFEAMKAGKLPIRLWLCCRVTENTRMDKPCPLCPHTLKILTLFMDDSWGKERTIWKFKNFTMQYNNEVAHWSGFFLRYFCFIHPIFRFWFLVTFGNKVMKIWKYYVRWARREKTERKSRK